MLNATMSSPDDRSRYIVEAADKALRVLTLVGEEPDCKLGDLAERAGLNKSRTLRLLATLELHKLVQRDADGRYRLGVQTLIMGHWAEEQIDIARIVQPHLNKLRDETGETTQFRIISGLTSLCVAKADSPHSIRAHAVIGRPRELYVGSAKVMLAFADDALVEAVIANGLQRFTHKTLADPAQLREELRNIRQQGFSISRSERLMGALALGAPVRDSAGNVAGCISLLGPENRIEPKIDALIASLRTEADAVSIKLGGSTH